MSASSPDQQWELVAKKTTVHGELVIYLIMKKGENVGRAEHFQMKRFIFSGMPREPSAIFFLSQQEETSNKCWQRNYPFN